jgi:biopolymer transport protein TolR
MGMDVSSSTGGRRRRNLALKPDINITPFVDVMLVLLIIFMVSAPLLTVGVSVDLPQSAAAPMKKQEEPIVVTLAAKGQIFLGETKLDEPGLLAKLSAIAANKDDSVIYVRADKNLSYGQVMRIMGLISGAGYAKVALVTEPLESGR